MITLHTHLSSVNGVQGGCSVVVFGHKLMGGGHKMKGATRRAGSPMSEGHFSPQKPTKTAAYPSFSGKYSHQLYDLTQLECVYVIYLFLLGL